MNLESGVGLIYDIARELDTAGFSPPYCFCEVDAIRERPLPMGRFERVTKVKVRWFPKPTQETICFHEEEREDTDYRISEIMKVLELIDTPNGLIRGHRIEGSIKDGATVVFAAYTEILREIDDPDCENNAKMGYIEATIGTGG